MSSFFIPGLIYDLTNSYNVAFFLSGLSPIIGASFLMLLHRIPKEDSPAILEDDGEYDDDIGDVFYDDSETAGKQTSGYGKLKKEPSVRRPSRKSTVTFNDDKHVIEENTELMELMKENVPPWKLYASDMMTAGMGKKRHINEETNSNKHSPQNGDIHVHRSSNGDVNGHVTLQEDQGTESAEQSVANEDDNVQESIV